MGEDEAATASSKRVSLAGTSASAAAAADADVDRCLQKSRLFARQRWASTSVGAMLVLLLSLAIGYAFLPAASVASFAGGREVELQCTRQVSYPVEGTVRTTCASWGERLWSGLQVL